MKHFTGRPGEAHHIKVMIEGTRCKTAMFPDRLKHLVKAMLSAWEPALPHDSWRINKTVHAPVTEEMALLQQCSWKFPHDKAEKVLNYQPVVSFEEGMRRSILWLEFIGMPVRNMSSNVPLKT